jgi:hypothetical protein
VAQGRLSKVLLLIGLAWMAFAENQIAVPSQMSYRTLYAVEHNRGVPVGTTSTVERPEIVGWAAHPQAAIILVALAVVFVLNLKLGATWDRWRYWIALAALAVCLLPAPGQTLLLAIPTFVLAGIAAIAGKPARAVAG